MKGEIELQFVDSSSPLYRVDYEENVVVVETEAGLRQVYRGLGAGARPTGEAVLADVIASLRGEKYRGEAKYHRILLPLSVEFRL